VRAEGDPCLLPPVVRNVMAGGKGPQVVAYVLGTDGGPQGLEGQHMLREAGCMVPATATATATATAIAARAALAAAALATRRSELVLHLP